jgi:hypothetical protein
VQIRKTIKAEAFPSVIFSFQEPLRIQYCTTNTPKVKSRVAAHHQPLIDKKSAEIQHFQKKYDFSPNFNTPQQ